MLLYAGLAGLQLAGGYFAADNIKKTAALNASIAEMNAEFAELDAYDAKIEGYSAQARYQTIIDQTLSDQTTVLAAADVDINYGSAAEVRDESRFIGEINKMEIEKQAQEKSLGYEQQASQYRMGGALNTASSKVDIFNAKFQGITGALGTGLTGYQRNRGAPELGKTREAPSNLKALNDVESLDSNQAYA